MARHIILMIEYDDVMVMMIIMMMMMMMTMIMVVMMMMMMARAGVQRVTITTKIMFKMKNNVIRIIIKRRNNK